MLIHLLCHAAFHGGERLLWLVDVKRFVSARRGRLDWGRFLQLLREWRLTHAARFALDRVESTLGACVPDEVRAVLDTERVSWRDRLALWQSPMDYRRPWMHTVVDLLCTDGLAFRLGYLRAVLMPDEAHLRETYRGRHWGWVMCAHAKRAVISVGRAVRIVRTDALAGANG